MATYTIDELRALKEKAVTYIKCGGHTPCHWLYRNKSEAYVKDILNKHNGLMATYVKDPSGDPRNPINGKLNGLFFMARHDDGQPPLYSAFGPVRIQIPVQELMNRTPHIYFADFFCLQSNWHYVTLVVTSSYSSAAWFCRDRLLRLDANNKQNNPFLYFERGDWWVSNAADFQVEVFFTEDIQVFTIPPAVQDAPEESSDIFDASLMAIPGAVMKAVSTYGRGSSIPGGVPKNAYCSMCNVLSLINTTEIDFL